MIGSLVWLFNNCMKECCRFTLRNFGAARHVRVGGLT
jgi:hypothetical protein